MQFPLNLPLPVAPREKGRSVSQNSIQGKICPAEQSRPFAWKKGKEKRESVTDAGRGPHAEAQARTSTAGKKERGIKTNKSQGEEVGDGRRSSRDFVWGLERSHTPVTNPCPPRAVMCEPYFGKLRQGEPQLLGEAVPAPGEAPGAASHRYRGLRGGREREAQPKPRFVRLCQTKISLTPSRTPLIPVTPSPTKAGNGGVRPDLGTQSSAPPPRTGSEPPEPCPPPSSPQPRPSLAERLSRLLGREKKPCPLSRRPF